MVTVVMGKLGSGKSYDMVRTMVEHVLRGGACRTNISLNYKDISKYYRRRLASWQVGQISQESDPALIPTGDRRGQGKRRVLVVLDEALNWFESTGTKDDKRRETWGRWLRQSDKLGQDVYFICQDFSRAAKWIRELAAQCIEMVPFRGISWLGIPWGRLPGLRNIYSRRVWDVRSHEVITWSLRKYSKEYWQFYDTSETYGFEGADSVYSGCVVFPRHKPIIFPFLLAGGSTAILWGWLCFA